MSRRLRQPPSGVPDFSLVPGPIGPCCRSFRPRYIVRFPIRDAARPAALAGLAGTTVVQMVGSAVPSVTGIEAGAVSEWLREHDPAATPPFQFELIAGGHSNLT